MTKTGKPPAPMPSKAQILEFLNDSDKPVGKREIARAFSLKGEQRQELRQILKELEEDGKLDRGSKRRMAPSGSLPEVTIIEITEMDPAGEIYARPVNQSRGASEPDEEGQTETIKILVMPSKRRGADAKIGDRVLARLRRVGKFAYEAQPIRILKPGAKRILGVLEPARHGCILRPTDKRNSKDFFVPEPDLKGAKAGALVLIEPMPGRALGPGLARVVEIIGSIKDPKAYSLIAIHSQGIPVEFPEDAQEEANRSDLPQLGDREDLRNYPLVTIDGSDARDFDDAVFAEPDDNPNNPDGWHLIVAIADVAEYVRPGGPLDKCAFERGNSVYFPDRVVPMLPEALSNELCSLKPKVDRACLAVHMWIDAKGTLIKHKFVRGLMNSHARFTYEEIQSAYEGQLVSDQAASLMDTVVRPLYQAYRTLDSARHNRGTLELDLVEHQVHIDEKGIVKGIHPRQRLDSHKLIEEFMITANVAAAEALEAKRMPVMYRVHEPPSMDKVEALRESLEGMGFSLPKGNKLEPRHFNGILKKAAQTEKSQIISDIVLRSQCQAIYSPDNEGHFGLALQRYAHFTSPIRRYSDILVHRALISGYSLGKDGLPDEMGQRFNEIGEHISNTERRASAAEREAMDRYITAYMSAHIEAEFTGRITGVTRFGLFVLLDETGADGLIPISTLPYDRYFHDEISHALIGENNYWVFTLGDSVTISLKEANPMTGGMVFELLEGGRQDRSAKKNRRGVKKHRKGGASHRGKRPKKRR